MEENEWLKKTALQVLGVTFIFGFASIALDVIPSVLNVLDDLISIFGSNFWRKTYSGD